MRTTFTRIYFTDSKKPKDRFQEELTSTAATTSPSLASFDLSSIFISVRVPVPCNAFSP